MIFCCFFIYHVELNIKPAIQQLKSMENDGQTNASNMNMEQKLQAMSQQISTLTQILNEMAQDDHNKMLFEWNLSKLNGSECGKLVNNCGITFASNSFLNFLIGSRDSIGVFEKPDELPSPFLQGGSWLQFTIYNCTEKLNIIMRSLCASIFCRSCTKFTETFDK